MIYLAIKIDQITDQQMHQGSQVSVLIKHSALFGLHCNTNPHLNVLDFLAENLVPACFSFIILAWPSLIPSPLGRGQGLCVKSPGGPGLFLAAYLPEQ